MFRSIVTRSLVISPIVISAVLLSAVVSSGVVVASTRPQYGGTLHVETAGDADTVAKPLIFDTLTRVANNGAVSPSLAVRWTQDNDAQRWQFWLRPSVAFHDGSPLTADDVVRSLQQDCGTACLWKTLRAVGDSIVMTSDSPVPTMPAELSRSLYIVAKKNDAGELDGTGAFKVNARSQNEVSLIAVNDAWSGRPYMDGVQIGGRHSVRTQWLDLSVGHVDVVDVPAEQIRQATQAHLTVTASRPVDLIALTVHAGALPSQEQRIAVADAVDRAALWNVIFQRQGEASASLLPNAISGYTFLFSTERSVARATQMLGGQHPTVTLAAEMNDATMQLAAERLVLNLRDAGFNAQIRPAGTPADLTLRRIHLGAGDLRAGVHEMLREFGKDADDGKGDAASLYRLERGFLDGRTVVPLLWLPRAYGVSPRVRGLRLGVEGALLLTDASLKADQP